MPIVPEAVIAATIQRLRPTRSAISLPTIDAGTATRLTTAAMAAACQGKPGRRAGSRNTRGTLPSAREPKSSRQWAAYPNVVSRRPRGRRRTCARPRAETAPSENALPARGCAADEGKHRQAGSERPAEEARNALRHP